MTVKVVVMVEAADGSTSRRGEFEFAALPRKDDLLRLRGAGPWTDICRVLGTEHEPAIEGEFLGRSEPVMRLIVKDIGDESDDD